MAGEQVKGLPEGLREWVHSRAEETERTPDEVLARAVAVSRLLQEHEGALPPPDALDPIVTDDPADIGVASDGADISARLDDLDERLDALDANLDEKIEDVRSRVIQVKREADAKADADHDHPDLREAADSAGELADDVASLDADLADLQESFEAGFANYEEVLEYLTDTAADHDAKLSTLASVVSDLRTRVSKVEADATQRRATADLKAEANRHGVAAAACDGCGSTVRLGLLSAPECPHCGSTFDSVEPASGFFRSATLTVGSRPALDGETIDDPGEADIFEEE